MTQIGRRIKREVIKNPKRIGIPVDMPMKAPPEWLPQKEPARIPVEIPARENANAS